MICPWFGPLPDWMGAYLQNVGRLAAHGFHWLITTDEDEFRGRCRGQLGVEPPELAGTGAIHAFRPAFGVLYQDLLAGFDFWGHTDFDVIYGRVERWLTADLLAGLDIYANHFDYISGPWTVYRNVPVVNELFMRHEGWQDLLAAGVNTGWGEVEFTAIVDEAHERGELVRVYRYWQTSDLNRFDTLRFDGDRLLEGDTEVFMAHFRRLRPKVYPAQLQPVMA